MLRSELLKLKEELAEERIQTENIIEGKEKEFKKEWDKWIIKLKINYNNLIILV